MQPKLRVLAVLLFLTFTAGAAMAATDDACSLVTQAQVSSAVGTSVSAGEYVTPTFKKTCTWHAKGIIVTLNLQDASAFDKGKQMAAYGAKMTEFGGLGDGAYYMTMGPQQVALMVKKGNTAFKVAVYSKLPIEKLEAMEKTVAQQVVGKL
ncbi:MAG TPA: hypothetical protein VL382_07155 [Terriglobales bacterium]|nr:hypothetical protein [Terriglobales bacterium]